MLLIFYNESGRKFHELKSCLDHNTKVAFVAPRKHYVRRQKSLFVLISEALKNEEKVVFWPLDEKYMKPMWGLYSLIEDNVNTFWFSPEINKIQIYSNKAFMKPILRRYGFNVLDNVSVAHPEKKYVIKSAVGSGSVGISFVKGDALNIEGLPSSKFVEESQEFIDYFGISGVAIGGNVLFLYSHERIVTKDEFGGASRVCKKITLDLELTKKVMNFILSEDYTGCFMFEFGQTEKDIILIELNPRLWGSFPLADQHFKKLVSNEFSTRRIRERFKSTFIFYLHFRALKFLIYNFKYLDKDVYLSPSIRNLFK